MKENEKGWIGMDRDKKGWKIIKNNEKNKRWWKKDDRIGIVKCHNIVCTACGNSTFEMVCVEVVLNEKKLKSIIFIGL